MQEFLDAAVDLAQRAGARAREHVDMHKDVRLKGTTVDVVTATDEANEKLIVDGLLAAFPDHAILGEEGGCLGNQASRYQWLVDPLDGTSNFSHGLRGFCVSIGLEVDRQPAMGVVYDPMLDELFTAVRGEGAFLNGAPIRVSDVDRLDRAMLATGFDATIRTNNPNNNLARFAALAKRTQAVRRLGSAALTICYVACGRLDGHWETHLAPWDLCAAVTIAREAGATLTDFEGGEHTIYGGTTVVSNGALHAQILEALAGAGPHSFTETVEL